MARFALSSLADSEFSHQVMTPIYRYMKWDDADRAKSGNFRFGRLIKYQLLELVTGDKRIGDSHEGVSKTILTTTINGDDQQQKLKCLTGISVAGEGSVVFDNCPIYSDIDAFVWCCTKRTPDIAPLLDLTYNACITVLDTRKFIEAIHCYGVESGTGQPIRELFPICHYGDVDYEWMEGNYAKDQITSPDPFSKRIEYIDQAEFRYVLYPAKQWHQQGDYVDVICAEAVKYLDICKILPKANIAVNQANFPPSKSKNDCEQELQSLYKKRKEIYFRDDHRQIIPTAQEESDVFKNRIADFNERHQHEVVRLLYQLRESQQDLTIDRKIVRGDGAYWLLQAWHMRETLSKSESKVR